MRTCAPCHLLLNLLLFSFLYPVAAFLNRLLFPRWRPLRIVFWKKECVRYDNCSGWELSYQNSCLHCGWVHMVDTLGSMIYTSCLFAFPPEQGRDSILCRIACSVNRVNQRWAVGCGKCKVIWCRHSQFVIFPRPGLGDARTELRRSGQSWRKLS